MADVDEPDDHRAVRTVRKEFTRKRGAGLGVAEALQATAADLELSLEDCASAVGRENLVKAMGDTWEISDDRDGRTSLRRPARADRDR
jgi:hypothetical protein